MSKRILSMILTLTLVLGSMSMAFAADVPADVAGTSIESAVERLGKLGILTGYDDGEFKADNDIKRSEFAAVVSRARGLEQAAQNSKGNTAFFDVPANHWASGYVKVADDAGLVKGMGVLDGKNYFRPDYNITYEQAVTLVVRALGYETEAVKNGGYPSGHLIVASQIGLLDGVNGVAGVNAKRGLVAQLVDNALDIPKMIDVGYGHIVSGSNNTKEVFLFDDMQLKFKDGQLKADSAKNKVSIGNVSLVVKDADFDYAGLDGLKVEAWYNKNNELITVKVKSDYTVKFDAIKINKTKNELTTVTEDKDYKFIDKTTDVQVKGEVGKYSDLEDKYNFAKIVLDEYGDVTWLEVYNLEEEVLVSSVKDNDVKGYNGDGLADANKYTIIKNGKQISHKSLNDKDLVLYNSSKKYAVVANNIVKGEIERVYSDSFKFKGENYSNTGVRYIDGENLKDVNKDVLDEMKSNGQIEVYFDFNNKPVLINGEVKELSSNYVMLTDDSVAYNARGDKYVTFDYITSEGTKVREELKVDSSGFVDTKIVEPKVSVAAFAVKDNTNSTTPNGKAKAGKVFKVTFDSKGNLSKIEDPIDDKPVGPNGIKLDNAYAEGFRLQSNTLVFWNEGTATDYSKYKVTTLDKAKELFNKVESGEVFVDKNGNIVAVVATKTDVDADTVWTTGIVKDVRETSNEYFVTLETNGLKTEYMIKKSDLTQPQKDLLEENTIVNLEVTEDKIGKSVKATDRASIKLTRTATGNEIVGKVGSSTTATNLVVEGKYYEKLTNGEFKRINASDFKTDDLATVYYREGSKKFVQAVVKGTDGPDVNATGVVTYKTTTIEKATDEVLVITLPKDNADVYTVKIAEPGKTLAVVTNYGAIVDTTTIKASELVDGSVITDFKAGKEDKTYILAVEKNGTEIERKRIDNKDMVAPKVSTLTSAVETTAAKASALISTDITATVNNEGAAGNNYEFTVVENTELEGTNAVKVTVDGYKVRIEYKGTITATELNADTDFKALFTASGAGTALAEGFKKATGGVDKAGASLNIALDKDVVVAKGDKLTLTIDGKSYEVVVETKTSAKDITVRFAEDVKQADIKTKDLEAIKTLKTVNGVEVDLTTAVTIG